MIIRYSSMGKYKDCGDKFGIVVWENTGLW